VITAPGTYLVEVAEVRCQNGRWFARTVHAEGERTGWTIGWDPLHGVREARAAQAMVGVRGRARFELIRQALRVAEWEAAGA